MMLTKYIVHYIFLQKSHHCCLFRNVCTFFHSVVPTYLTEIIQYKYKGGNDSEMFCHMIEVIEVK